MKKSMIAVTALVLVGANFSMAEARDQIRIVGSSTVYPFASYVAEEFGATTKFKTPVIESTGSGGGLKLFCAGAGMDSPDITNASRRIKAKEIKLCAENGVKEITEAVIGYDGITVAQSKETAPISLTRKELMLAVAAEVPSKDGKSLIKNPYKFWNEINAKLPHRPILFYGPPTSSGTRDAFEDMVLKHLTKHMDVYTNLYKADPKKNKAYKKFHEIRQDGVYVPAGENDNLIVAKLEKDRNALGIFGYSFLEENSDRIAAASVDGEKPAPDTISSGKYPLSRSLYFYIKKSHEGKVPGIKEYVNLFMNDSMIGSEGHLSEIGLIPLPQATRNEIRKRVESRANISEADLKK